MLTRGIVIAAGRWWMVATLALAAPTLRADDAFGPSLLSPADYVMHELERHPIVLLGEAHWIRHDAQLVAGLVPHLAAKRVVLAMETVRASDQVAIDGLVSGPAWDESAAMRVMRSASWPYREYLDILRAAWSANRAAAGSMKVLALAPDPDWRETLLRAKGVTYDAFMADRIAAEHAEGRRVLVYCGIHHAFTRYYQPELDLEGRAWAFMDRTGNILLRRLGERVFLITLHRPLWCGKEPWSYCLPLDGAIDCAASKGGRAVGFEVLGSTFADRSVDAGVYYAHGHAGLRFGEMTDGYIWSKPIEDYENVRLIPLSEFAPDEAALREVAARNPFSNEQGLPADRLQALWSEEEKRRADPLAHRRWLHLKGWRQECASATASPGAKE